MTARYARGILIAAAISAAAPFLRAQTQPLAIVTDALPPASVGTLYNQQLVTSGGVCTGAGTPSSAIVSGGLPSGLSIASPPATPPQLPAEQWFIQGVPSATGSSSFTVRVGWDHVKTNPFDHIETCHEEAVKSLTLVVLGPGQGNPTLVADRTQIVTTYRTGTLLPGPDTVNVTSTGGPVAITAGAVTDSGGGWLSVVAQGAITPAALKISYSISGLAPGTYTGRVTVSAAGVTALTIPVTLQVVNSSVQLTADRTQIATTYRTGTVPPVADTVNVTSTGGPVAITAGAVTDSGGGWLRVVAQGATTPAALSITYSVSGLAPGTYTGRVTVSAGGVTALTIPVTLQVLDSNVQLAVDRTQITTTYHTGTFPPGSDTVNVTSTGAPAAITAQAVTDAGGGWLSVVAQGATTPAALSISYSISGLSPGTYNGRVTVSTGGVTALTIPVTLQVVVDSNVQLQATPSSLVFSAVLGGADPPAQTVTVTVAGLSRLFEANVTAPPNGKWLTVTPSAAATKATLTVTVAAKGLAAAA